MKQRVILVCLAVMLMVVAAGCGGGSRGGELDGRWEHLFGRNDFEVWEFSGNGFVNYFYIEGRGQSPQSSGTFSISENQIEFVLDSATIDFATAHMPPGMYIDPIRVASFSRTENTITIDGDRFDRVR